MARSTTSNANVLNRQDVHPVRGDAVTAAPADHEIARAVADADAVRARCAVDRVGAGAAGDAIRARAAIDPVHAGAAGDAVAAGTALNRVVARTAVDRARARAAADAVDPAAPAERVVPPPPEMVSPELVPVPRCVRRRVSLPPAVSARADLRERVADVVRGIAGAIGGVGRAPGRVGRTLTRGRDRRDHRARPVGGGPPLGANPSLRGPRLRPLGRSAGPLDGGTHLRTRGHDPRTAAPPLGTLRPAGSGPARAAPSSPRHPADRDATGGAARLAGARTTTAALGARSGRGVSRGASSTTPTTQTPRQDNRRPASHPRRPPPPRPRRGRARPAGAPAAVTAVERLRRAREHAVAELPQARDRAVVGDQGGVATSAPSRRSAATVARQVTQCATWSSSRARRSPRTGQPRPIARRVLAIDAQRSAARARA